MEVITIPLYSYKCEFCGHNEEHCEPIAVVNNALPVCPKCASSMRRVIYPAEIHGVGKRYSSNHLPVEKGGEWEGGHKVKRRKYYFQKENKQRGNYATR